MVTMIASIMVRKHVGKVEHFLVAGREVIACYYWKRATTWGARLPTPPGLSKKWLST